MTLCLPFSIANIVTFPLSGILCESGIDGGWPMVFYVPGAGGLLWTAVFLGLAYPSPQVHPRIGSAEKKMLTATALSGENDQTTDFTQVPWLAMMTSWKMWGLIMVSTYSSVIVQSAHMSK